MKRYLESGQIVGTHGVRGMVRIQPWCDTPAFLCGFKKIYGDEGQTVWKVIKAQPHGNVVIAALQGVDSIEAAEKLCEGTDVTPVLFKKNDAIERLARYASVGISFDQTTASEYLALTKAGINLVNVDIFRRKRLGKNDIFYFQQPLLHLVFCHVASVFTPFKHWDC